MWWVRDIYKNPKAHYSAFIFTFYWVGVVGEECREEQGKQIALAGAETS